MSRIYQDNSQSIGNTPLVRLNHVTKGAQATVLAKVEGRNPASVQAHADALGLGRHDAKSREALRVDLRVVRAGLV